MSKKAIRILYVDNHASDRELVRDALEEGHQGFQLTEATSRQEFEARLAEENYDLILSDVNILGFEGLEVIDTTRAQDPRLPIIIVTGSGSEQIAAESIKRGAADYIIKTRKHIRRLPHAIQAVIEKSCLENEHRRVEEALRRRDEILKAVAFTAERLLRLSDLETGIPGVLARIGEATDVSRVYIFENRTDEHGTLLTNQRYEWVAPGITSKIDALQNFSPLEEGYERWVETLNQGQILYGLAREFAPGERELLEFQNIQSIVLVPIFTAGERWGSIGFDECTHERKWSSAETEALQVAANVLGAAIQRREANKALQESEARFRELVEMLPEIVYETDDKGRVTFLNQRAFELTGHTQDDLNKGLTAADYFSPEDLERAQQNLDRLLRGESVAKNEYTLLRKDKSTFPIIEQSTPIVRDGKIIGLRGIVFDISERVRAEQALRESEKRFRLLYEKAPLGYQALDEQGRFIEVNQAWLDTLEYSRQEIIGHWFGEFLAPQYVDHFKRNFPRFKAVGEIRGIEFEMVRKDGSHIIASFNGRIGHDEQGNFKQTHCILHDITQRKQAEEALHQRNRELALLNRLSQALNSTLDLDQVLIAALEEVRHLMGVVACSVWLVDAETDELVCRQVTEPQSEIVRGWRLSPGQGLAGWVAQSGTSLIVPDIRTDARHFKGVDHQTGLELRSILTTPLQGKQKIIGVLQIVDETVNRFTPADLTLLEPLAATAAMAVENAQLYEQARQDAETQFALLREVNHRVKNNLTAIIGLLYTAQRHARVEDRATYQSTMSELISRVRGLTMVHDMLSASKWAPLRLSDLTAQAIRASLQMLPRDKHIAVDVPPSPVRVTPDHAHHLALVINELATNTIKYALQERDTACIAVRIALEDDVTRCEFRDDGPGYPEEVLRLERHNVGLDLIQNIVHDNLRGELSLYNDQGAVATIQFKTKIDDKESG